MYESVEMITKLISQYLLELHITVQTINGFYKELL